MIFQHKLAKIVQQIIFDVFFEYFSRNITLNEFVLMFNTLLKMQFMKPL